MKKEVEVVMLDEKKEVVQRSIVQQDEENKIAQERRSVHVV